VNKLALLFHSEVRAEILRLLFGLKQKPMYRAEIIGRTDFANRSVEEELQKLVTLELLTTTLDGNRRYYTANQAHPLYPELHNIVLKTSGLKDLLLEALPPKKIDYAFVFGSVAALNERADSDLDLLIVGSVRHRDIASALRALTERLGREINALFYTREELNTRLDARDHFLSGVLAKPKLFILGDEHEFTDLARRRLAAKTSDQS
jgi:predicted nucleotidyltransferase